jgi:hypothetical protein
MRVFLACLGLSVALGSAWAQDAAFLPTTGLFSLNLEEAGNFNYVADYGPALPPNEAGMWTLDHNLLFPDGLALGSVLRAAGNSKMLNVYLSGAVSMDGGHNPQPMSPTRHHGPVGLRVDPVPNGISGVDLFKYHAFADIPESAPDDIVGVFWSEAAAYGVEGTHPCPDAFPQPAHSVHVWSSRGDAAAAAAAGVPDEWPIVVITWNQILIRNGCHLGAFAPTNTFQLIIIQTPIIDDGKPLGLFQYRFNAGDFLYAHAQPECSLGEPGCEPLAFARAGFRLGELTHELLGEVSGSDRIYEYPMATNMAPRPVEGGEVGEVEYRAGVYEFAFAVGGEGLADEDDDGVPDIADNCPDIVNANQADADSDSRGDVCDPDPDSDGVRIDNCPLHHNPAQIDSNGNGTGDACEDRDEDGVPNSLDTCPDQITRDQRDSDGDGAGDACDDDDDADWILDATDNCPLNPNFDQHDTDGDGIGDACDHDIDGDGAPNPNRLCAALNLPELNDQDLDGVGDRCDNCPGEPNPTQINSDFDWLGDACDADLDGDGVENPLDNCRAQPNPNQLDQDRDTIGDACDVDRDGDGIRNAVDNCAWVPNADQLDANGDARGDACQLWPRPPMRLKQLNDIIRAFLLDLDILDPNVRAASFLPGEAQAAAYFDLTSNQRFSVDDVDRALLMFTHDEVDADGDGLIGIIELECQLGPDGEPLRAGLDPDLVQSTLGAPDAELDCDGDGLGNLWEVQFNLNPLDPADGLLDPDDDGQSNVVEQRNGTDPWVHNEPPAEPIPPAPDEPDPDAPRQEPDPKSEDSDKDGLSDADELRVGLDPKTADTHLDHDKDGVPSGAEANAGLDPWDPKDVSSDADNDGYEAWKEIQMGRDPNWAECPTWPDCEKK